MLGGLTNFLALSHPRLRLVGDGSPMRRDSWASTRRACSALGVIAAACALIPAAAGAATEVSSNWAGYVASGHGKSGFHAVSGTWTVPAVTCDTGRATYSAVWVGLGGFRHSSERLEQLGTMQDCSAKNAASYEAWLEILPAAPVTIHVTVHAGDLVSASTTVTGRTVAFRLEDLTTGARFATHRHVAAVDVSTADWIVEAPSVCSGNGRCESLPLAGIAPVQFSGAVARAAARAKPAGDAGWDTTTLKLEQDSVRLAASGSSATGPVRDVVTASPSPITRPSGAFSVSLREQTMQLPLPAGPTLPGFGSG